MFLTGSLRACVGPPLGAANYSQTTSWCFISTSTRTQKAFEESRCKSCCNFLTPQRYGIKCIYMRCGPKSVKTCSTGSKARKRGVHNSCTLFLDTAWKWTKFHKPLVHLLCTWNLVHFQAVSKPCASWKLLCFLAVQCTCEKESLPAWYISRAWWSVTNTCRVDSWRFVQVQARRLYTRAVSSSHSFHLKQMASSLHISQ